MVERLSTTNHRRQLERALNSWGVVQEVVAQAVAAQAEVNAELAAHLRALEDGTIAVKGVALSVSFKGYESFTTPHGGYPFPADLYKVGRLQQPAANGHRQTPYANIVGLTALSEASDIDRLRVWVTPDTLELATEAEVAVTHAERAARTY